jgi:hypothetical protein
MANNECGICCERYNRTKHVKITCPYCSKSACRECSQRFILDKSEPMCMMCDHPWNRDFVDESFTKQFRNGDLKRKREDVLLGIEEAMLPDTQQFAAMELRKRELDAKKDEIAQKIKWLTTQIREYKDEMYALEGRIYRLKDGIERGIPVPLVDGQGNNTNDDENGPTKKESRKFIKHCPQASCKGFLTTQYNCGLCHIKVCPRCLEPKENGQEGSSETAAHVCNPDTVASVELLIRDTRPCPQCATPIHKIDGCDQMWCTQCHTAFSWRTGRVETGRVHNPHWYEYQRRVNNGVVPREPGDQAGGGGAQQQRCPPNGAIPGLFTIPRPDTKAAYIELQAFHRSMVHIQHVVMPPYMENARRDLDNRDLRIKYLIGEVDKDKWKKLLQQREKRRLKKEAMRQAFEVLLHGSSDVLHRMTIDKNFTWDKAKKELETLRAYTNECLYTVCSRFSVTTRMTISNQWEVVDY